MRYLTKSKAHALATVLAAATAFMADGGAPQEWD
eukprot:COSAG03_NODE_12054_length_563_cov_1.540948_1_plen_33_part_10